MFSLGHMMRTRRVLLLYSAQVISIFVSAIHPAFVRQQVVDLWRGGERAPRLDLGCIR